MTSIPDNRPAAPETNPDAALLKLRPAVAAANPDAVETNTVGAFLHATLRPVLKLLNERLLATVADFARDYHLPLRPAAPLDQQRLVAELLGRNTKLRYTVVGLITGHFTAPEYAFYRQHRAELNRRLLELAQRRVHDQMNTLVALATG